MNIPKGYAVHITSWENDGDYFKTQSFYGLTEKDTRFIIELAKLFRSQHTLPHQPRGFGGSRDHYTGNYNADVIKAYNGVVDKYMPDLSPHVIESLVPDPTFFEGTDEDWDLYIDYLDELVGRPENEHYSVGYVRVYSGHTVQWYETEIPDVSERFP